MTSIRKGIRRSGAAMAALAAGLVWAGVAGAEPVTRSATLYATAPGLAGEGAQAPALAYITAIEAVSRDLDPYSPTGQKRLALAPHLTSGDLRRAGDTRSRIRERIAALDADRARLLAGVDARMVAATELIRGVEREAAQVRERAMEADDAALMEAADDVTAFVTLFYRAQARVEPFRGIIAEALTIARDTPRGALRSGWAELGALANDYAARVNSFDWTARYVTDDIMMMAAHHALLGAYLRLYSAELDQMLDDARDIALTEQVAVLGALAAPLNSLRSQSNWRIARETLVREHDRQMTAANALSVSSGFDAVGARHDVPVQQRALCVESEDGVPRPSEHVARVAVPITLTYRDKAGYELDGLPFAQYRKGAAIWQPSVPLYDDNNYRAPCDVLRTNAITEDGARTDLMRRMRTVIEALDYHLAQVESYSIHHAILGDLEAQASHSEAVITALSSALSREPRVAAQWTVETQCEPRRRRNGIPGSGTLLVEIQTSPRGQVRQVGLLDDSAFEGRTSRALTAIDQGFRCEDFDPHTIDGEPIDGRLTLRISTES